MVFKTRFDALKRTSDPELAAMQQPTVLNVKGVQCRRFSDGRVVIDGVPKEIRVHPRFRSDILALSLARSSNIGELERTFILSLTDRCNIQCDFCCHPFLDSEISDEDAFRLTAEAAALGYDEICCTGGEPFLRKGTLFKLANVCRKSDTLFGVISNGYWAKHRDRGFRLANELAQAGLCRLTISWDPSHGEFVTPQTAQNAIDAGMNAGLKVCLTGSFKQRGDSHGSYGIDTTPYESYDNFTVYSFPVSAAGRAAESDLGQEHGRDGLAGRDREDPLLCTIAHKRETVVYARGGLTQPCCSLYAGYKMSSMGVTDWRASSVQEIRLLQDGEPFNRIINVRGFRFLYGLVESRDSELFKEMPPIDVAESVCELCSRIMTPELGPRIRALCEEYVSEEIAAEVMAVAGQGSSALDPFE